MLPEVFRVIGFALGSELIDLDQSYTSGAVLSCELNGVSTRRDEADNRRLRVIGWRQSSGADFRFLT